MCYLLCAACQQKEVEAKIRRSALVFWLCPEKITKRHIVYTPTHARTETEREQSKRKEQEKRQRKASRCVCVMCPSFLIIPFLLRQGKQKDVEPPQKKLRKSSRKAKPSHPRTAPPLGVNAEAEKVAPSCHVPSTSE